ncbi:polysaccharide pyruvyl transferase family protein [Nocardia sp. NPDC046473]|uniref:polysaccharide pyruvyl transferase family protein n=1 Tax=Nocardia sp. NPDC046473 TaxID=3155733 RepID=UPI0033F83DDC
MRIGVVTAANAGLANTGMLSVDLAFWAFSRRLSDADITWYTIQSPDVEPIRRFARDTELPFSFRPLLGAETELADYDAVVFWGDFLHARHYLEQDALYWLTRQQVVATRAEARDLLDPALLLSTAPDEVIAKTISYGSTVLHNTQHDYADDSYRSAFFRLVSGCRMIWVRDAISAATVTHIRRDYEKSHFGTDAALLLRPGDLDFLPRSGWADESRGGDTIGVFVGARTPVPNWLPDFWNAISDRLGARLEWFPWLDDKVPAEAADLATRPGDYSVGDLFTRLAQYRLVITDTYHLCINAWRSGVPAICIGAPEPGPAPYGFLSVSNLKKHVFYLAYNATDFYLSTVDEGEAARVEQIKRIATLIEDGGAASITERMRQHADEAEKQLTGALHALR